MRASVAPSPPLTSTRPLVSSVAEPPLRAVIEPALLHVPVEGSKISVVALLVVPLPPQTTSTRPSLRAVAVCPPRWTLIDATAVQVLRLGS